MNRMYRYYFFHVPSKSWNERRVSMPGFALDTSWADLNGATEAERIDVFHEVRRLNEWGARDTVIAVDPIYSDVFIHGHSSLVYLDIEYRRDIDAFLKCFGARF